MTPSLSQIRQTCRLTPRQMARLLGIHQTSNYTRLEAGRREPTDQLMAAARMIEFVYQAGLLSGLLAQATRPPSALTGLPGAVSPPLA